MNLKRDPEKASGLGTGKRMNLILDLSGKMSTRGGTYLPSLEIGKLGVSTHGSGGDRVVGSQ